MQIQAATASVEHLAYQQIAAFVDDELDAADRACVESHITICAICADEVSDLQAFRTTLTSPAKENVEIAATSTVWEWLRAFWEQTAVPPRLATTSLIVVVLVLSIAAIIFVWRTRSRTNIVVTERSDVAPQTGPRNEDKDNSNNSVSPSETKEDDLVVQSGDEIAFNDAGGRIVLNKQGNITGLDTFSSSLKSVVAEAVIAERVKPPQVLAQLSGRTGTLLGDNGERTDSSLLSPVGVIVRNERPRFRWRPVSGASSYTVNVLDSDFNVIQTSPSLTTTSWTPPSGLPRGAVLSWQVTAVKDEEKLLFPSAPSPEAKFKILEIEKARELQQAENSRPRSHLVLGVLYARAGLIDESERELLALLTANPQSVTASKLLASVRAEKRKRTR